MELLHLTATSIRPLITSLLLVVVAVITAVGSRGSREGVYFIYWVMSLAVWLFLLWLPSIFFVFLMLTTDQFFIGMYHDSWGYYPQYGPVGIGFIVWFSLLTIAALSVLVSSWRNALPGSNSRKRNGRLVVMLGFTMVGGMDFLPNLGIDLYPVGWLPVLLYSLTAIYLMFKYPLTYVRSAYTSEQVIDSVGSCLLIVDEDHLVRLANPAIGKILAVEPKQVCG